MTTTTSVPAAGATSVPALPLSPPVNLRDLAGIPILGGITRPGFAWRADDLSLADDASARRLVGNGLSAVVDLRSVAEVEVTGRGVLGSLPVAYHHVPFMASIGTAMKDAAIREDAWDQSRFADMYIGLFENAAPQIVTALAVIAHSPGATVFHCAAGQDRTGVLAAALLLCLGAETEHIVRDYARTGENIDRVSARVRPVIEPVMARMGVRLDPAARAATRTVYSEAPIRGLLEHLHTAYPDPLQPLRGAGLTDGLCERLRRRALSA
ncbi:tyrosine-protein phosphatase [Dietzia lutea]|uniref:Transcriptional regulator n=1 Tax=Dietzia lutea TaxID=546160 RepID=A0A2S1R871_9ACTN|nr:tyrosine-protein phosphatase [Dietzia lutea]AWH92490.1 transcriptional regulator [Dietzia lutea]